MREARSYSAAALNDRYGWVISGGYGGIGKSKLSSVEHTSDGRNFETLPSMPIPLVSHCLVSLDGDEDGDLFVTGGYADSDPNKRAFLFKNGSWKEMESMPTARQSLMCGPVRSQPGGPVEKIVVTGGYKDGRLATVEVYNVKENSWETADDLPFGPLFGAAVIPFEDTFIMIGGYGSNGYSDKLWKYKKSGEWEEMPKKLNEGKVRATAIAVPSNIFPSC